MSEDDIVAKPGEDLWRAAGLGLRRQHSEAWAFQNPSAREAAVDSTPWVTENPRVWGSSTGSTGEPPPRRCEGRCAAPASCPPVGSSDSCFVHEGRVCLDCGERGCFVDGCRNGSGSDLPRPRPSCGGDDSDPSLFRSSGGGWPSGATYFLGSSWSPISSVGGGRRNTGTVGNAPGAAEEMAAAAAAAMGPNGGDDDDAQSLDLCYSSSSCSGGEGGNGQEYNVQSPDLCYSSSSSSSNSSSSGSSSEGEEPDETLYFYGSFDEAQDEGGPAGTLPRRLSPRLPFPAKPAATAAPEILGTLNGHVDESSGGATASISSAGMTGRWANGGNDEGGNDSGGELDGVLNIASASSDHHHHHHHHHASNGENSSPVDSDAAGAGAGAVGINLKLDVSSRRRVQSKYRPFPWRAMGMNSAAWACVAGNVGAGIAINVVMSWLPTYYEEFILVDLEDIGSGALVRWEVAILGWKTCM